MNPEVYRKEDEIKECVLRIQKYASTMKDVTFKFDILKALDLINNEKDDIKRLYMEIEELEMEDDSFV